MKRSILAVVLALTAALLVTGAASAPARLKIVTKKYEVRATGSASKDWRTVSGTVGADNKGPSCQNWRVEWGSDTLTFAGSTDSFGVVVMTGGPKVVPFDFAGSVAKGSWKRTRSYTLRESSDAEPGCPGVCPATGSAASRSAVPVAHAADGCIPPQEALAPLPMDCGTLKTRGVVRWGLEKVTKADEEELAPLPGEELAPLPGGNAMLVGGTMAKRFKSCKVESGGVSIDTLLRSPLIDVTDRQFQRLRKLGVGRSITFKQAGVGLHACAKKPPAGHTCSLDYSVKLAVKRVA